MARRKVFRRGRVLGGAILEIEPGEMAALDLQVDLADLEPELALVFHLAQFGARNRGQGGFTAGFTAPDR